MAAYSSEFHLRDMLTLEFMEPTLAQELKIGNFVVKKCKHDF